MAEPLRINIIYRYLYVKSLMLLVIVLFLSKWSFSQIYKVGSVDIFGNRKTSASTIKNLVGIREGDSLSANFDKEKYIARIMKTAAVKKAGIANICCDANRNSWLFIGVTESDSVYTGYNETPTKDIKLRKEIIDNYIALGNARHQLLLNGTVNEDDSNGYALINDSTCRNYQQNQIVYASKYLTELIDAIHQSADWYQRGIACDVMAYSADKRRIVEELLYAVNDNNEMVRNNAARALAILAKYAQSNPDLKIYIPPQQFIRMLYSVEWTDRNKGTLVLEALTKNRDTLLLTELKTRVLPELIEMANWKSSGHAYPSYIILARIAGLPEKETITALFSDKKDAYLENIISKIKKE